MMIAHRSVTSNLLVGGPGLPLNSTMEMPLCVDWMWIRTGINMNILPFVELPFQERHITGIVVLCCLSPAHGPMLLNLTAHA